MGTRADFYVGRGDNAEWIGSVAWDGYPDGIEPDKGWPDGAHLFDSLDEVVFRERLAQFFQHRRDVTLPDHGWPWPWETSATTDYAYAFDAGRVHASCFGGAWFDPREEPDDNEDDSEQAATFPNMKDRQNVTLGERSGLIVVTLPEG